MPEQKNIALRLILGWALVILGAAAFGVMIAMGASCAGQSMATRLETIEKLAQCVEPVVLNEIAAREAAASAAAQTVGKPGAAAAQTPHEAVDTTVRDAGAM